MALIKLPQPKLLPLLQKKVPVSGLNEIRYTDETEGARYYLWSCATVGRDMEAEVLFSREAPADKSHTSPVLTPSAAFLNGEKVTDLNKEWTLKKGANPFLVRYDNAGRGHFVLREKGVPAAESKQPLSMRWSAGSGVIPFDVSAGKTPAEWFRFTTAPGTTAIRVQTGGTAEAWINGEPMKKDGDGRFLAVNTPADAATVALRIQPGSPGITGGALIPGPVTVETDGSGTMELGDWSQKGILNNYSGGVRYLTNLTLTAAEAKSPATIDLGSVAGTSEVIINGKKAGIRVAPPWKLEVSGYLKAGNNSIEVLVYNTLSNHYQTIPSRYRGNPVSGLLGPVKLVLED